MIFYYINTKKSSFWTRYTFFPFINKIRLGFLSRDLHVVVCIFCNIQFNIDSSVRNDRCVYQLEEWLRVIV